jgi:hypothetical protein
MVDGVFISNLPLDNSFLPAYLQVQALKLIKMESIQEIAIGNQQLHLKEGNDGNG